MKKGLLATLLVFVVALTGCSSSSDTFTYGVDQQIESLDLTKAAYHQTFILYADVFSGLTHTNANGEIENAGAESITVSEDGLTYTIKLRQDMKWVDSTGQEMGNVTANDYVFTYQRMVDPTVASLYSYIYAIIDNANEIMMGELPVEDLAVTAIDDYTLEIRLDHPAPYFESMLAFGAFLPQSKDAYEMYGNDFATDAQYQWYNGPYYVTSFDPSYVVSVTKNPLYYSAENVQVENIDYRLNKDSTSRYNAFLNGELDFATVTNSEDYAAGIADGTVVDNLTGYSFYAQLNTQETAHTGNENLRKALAYGLDRDTIVNSVFGELNKPIEYIIPSGMTPAAYDGLEYRDIAGDSLITYDEEKANQYFDAYMADMGFTDRSQIEVEYLTSDADTNKRMAEAVQSTYSQTFGITVNITTQPFTQFTETKRAGGYDMNIIGWGPDYADPSTYLALWQTANIGSLNDAFYSNPDYDSLYVAADNELDPQTRFEEFAILEQKLVDDAVLIPLYQKNEPYGLNPDYSQPTHLFFIISHEYLTKNAE